MSTLGPLAFGFGCFLGDREQLALHLGASTLIMFEKNKNKFKHLSS